MWRALDFFRNPICPTGQRLDATAGTNMDFVTAILAINTPGDEIIFNLSYYLKYDLAIG